MKLWHILCGALAIMALLSLGAAPAPQSSPIPPPGLENCRPLSCIENLECVGHPTCNAFCVEYYDLDVAPEYVSPYVIDGQCYWPPLPPGLEITYLTFVPLVVGD